MAGTNYTVPPAPPGTDVILRARLLESGQTEVRLAAVGDTGTYSPYAPLQFFVALDGAGNWLAIYSPAYGDGWESSYRISSDTHPGIAACEALRIAATARKSPTGHAGSDSAIAECRRWWSAILGGKVVRSNHTVCEV